MEAAGNNPEDMKKNARKAALPGEIMVAAICFMIAAAVLFAFDLAVFIITKGRARATIIIQSAVCVLLLMLSLLLCFASVLQRNKLNRRHIVEDICAHIGANKAADADADSNPDSNPDSNSYTNEN